MGKSVRAGVVVEVVVLVAAVAFSIAYFALGLYRTSQRFDAVLIMLWIVVAAVLLFVMWWRSLLREEMRRRFYLSDEWIYNFEIGYAPLSRIIPDRDVYSFVSFAADSLATMSYGFEVAETPARFMPKYLISTQAFNCHQTEDGAIVVDRWKGVLKRAADTDDDFEVSLLLAGLEASQSLAELEVGQDEGGSGAMAPSETLPGAAPPAPSADDDSYVETGRYGNARELAMLLEECGAFA